MHLHFAGRAEFFARPVDAFDPVAAHRSRVPAGNAKWRNAAVIGKHYGHHRLEKANPPFGAVASAMASSAAARTTN